MLDKETVSKFFREKAYRPLTFKEAVSALGINRAESKVLSRILVQLLKSGELIRTKNGRFAPSEEMALVKGYFEAHRDGYGFVIPDASGEKDIFIPPGSTMWAMDNDRVVARLEDRSKRQGRIIRVVERAHARITGVFDTSREGSYVRPGKKSVPFDLYIPHGDSGGAKRGEKVVAEVAGYPDKRLPTGRIIKVIKKASEPRAEVEAVIDEYGLPRKFPKEAVDEARLLSGKSLKGRRKDLSNLPTVTIDGERAKDFDDAVSIELHEHGYRLYVHIADVGHYVRWDSSIDLEARRRATSVYFPDRVIHMLPRELSEDLCSLKPGVPKAAFTVEMTFDRQGNPAESKFYRSLINSNERLTYTSVNNIIVNQDAGERRRYDYLLGDFELMGELCGILRSKRLRRGSLDFDLPEPEVLLDVQGRPEAIIRAERNLAHMLIEEFMIAANEAVASHIYELGVPALYRIHEKPDPEKLIHISRLFSRSSKVSQADISLHSVIDSVKGRPEEEAVIYMALRSLKRARYSRENAGHFGLASRCYTHFTSPIRRYPDLVVHRILADVLERKSVPEKRIKWLGANLPDIAYHSSHMERVAERAENDVVDSMKAWFMKDKVGEEFEGKIIGIAPYGIRVRLKEFFIEGFLHVSSMHDDFYLYNEKDMSLKGRHRNKTFRPGQPILVRVDRVNIEEREIIFGA